MATPLYFVRHGETDWNVEGRLQGQSDIHLNAVGRAQATTSGQILHELLARDGRSAAEFDFVASPLLRARETMELIRTALGLDPLAYRIDPRLLELSFGVWEGSTIAEIRARDPGAVAERERDKWGFVPPGGESYEQLSKRIGAWYATLHRDSIAVAHGGTARALMALLDVTPPDRAPLVDIEQGVVYAVDGSSMTIYSMQDDACARARDCRPLLVVRRPGI